MASLLTQHSRHRGRRAANQIAAKPLSCDTTDDSSSDCSDDEWSIESSKVNHPTSQRSKVDNPASQKFKMDEEATIKETSKWNGSEITYFRMLRPIFVNNFCAMSQLLRSKTCLEVFQHAQCVASEIRKPKDRRLAVKKKKKSMRYVRM